MPAVTAVPPLTAEERAALRAIVKYGHVPGGAYTLTSDLHARGLITGSEADPAGLLVTAAGARALDRCAECQGTGERIVRDVDGWRRYRCAFCAGSARAVEP